MLWCIYSSEGGGKATAPDLEVSCVTGLPARTARPFVPPFFCAVSPVCCPFRLLLRFRFLLVSVYNEVERFCHDKYPQASLGSWFGCLRHHCGQLCAVVQPRRRCSRLSPFRPSQGKRLGPHPVR